MPKKGKSKKTKVLKKTRRIERYERHMNDLDNAKTKEEKDRLWKQWKSEHVCTKMDKDNDYAKVIAAIQAFVSQDKYKDEHGETWQIGKTLKNWELVGRRTKFRLGKQKWMVYDTRKWTGLSWAESPLYPTDYIICHGDRCSPDLIDPLKKELKNKGFNVGSRLGFY